MNQKKIADIDPLETHDRLTYVKDSASPTTIDMLHRIITSDPFKGRKFYIFAHTRTEDNGIDKRLIWQYRLGKPKAQTNSMLFRVDPKEPDLTTVIWLIPDRDQWHLYEKGKMFENETVILSIDAFVNERKKLEAPDPDDPEPFEIQQILYELYPNLFRTKPNLVS